MQNLQIFNGIRTAITDIIRFFAFLILYLGIHSLTFSQTSYSDLAKEVTIRRTSYGVPHIRAGNLKGVAFGLAWCELEDYGERVIKPLIAARGELARVDGSDALEADFFNQLGYQRAVETYTRLDQDTRDMLEGFAMGVNYYLEKYPEKFEILGKWRFTGYDVAATTTFVSSPLSGQRFADRLKRQKAIRDSIMALEEAGSNAWAFAPERTKSGHTILVRNPHLNWNAGYYEAHLTVPGKLNFYGDFRIGGLFAIIGGFNDRLGWSTTNNHPDLEEIYALSADPERLDHYILDGASIPIQRKMMTATFRNGDAFAQESREFLFTPFGPVIHRAEGKIYILRQAGDGEFRRGQQFVRMMLAQNLQDWKDAMRMQAITASNYTYADADGNIFYVWNATTPKLKHPSGGDTAAVEIESVDQLWKEVISFDQLPQLHNPQGGYLHNENDPFHFTNLNQILRPEDFPQNFPKPRLRQRSQHSLLLIHNSDKLSLEDVVERKHSMRMLVADQLKSDLIEAIKRSRPKNDMRKAMKYLVEWDNLVSAESHGGVLFQEWFVRYARKMAGKELFEIPWSFDSPTNTPSGLADEELAVAAFKEAITELINKYGGWDFAWGDVHRLRHGDLDLPVGGGPGGLGCFRVLWFQDGKDGKREIRGGDGWQLAVEFSNPPSAYSVLAYGQSNNPDSPHHTDQAELFAKNQMKKVAFTEDDIAKKLIRSYHPGDR